MTTKPLILLGAVAALAIAGGEANAQEPCPTQTASQTVAQIEATHGFSCLQGNMTFSDFRFTGLPTNADVFFAPRSQNFVDALVTQGSAIPLTGTPQWDFTVTTTPGNVIALGAVSVSFFSPVSIEFLSTMNQTLVAVCIPHSACQTDAVAAVVPPARNVTVANSATITPGGTGGGVAGFTNVFGSQPAAGTPEPMSLSLFGLGLAGLALARRRRS